MKIFLMTLVLATSISTFGQAQSNLELGSKACVNAAISAAVDAFYPGCEDTGTCPSNLEVTIDHCTPNSVYFISVNGRPVRVATEIFEVGSKSRGCRATLVTKYPDRPKQ